MIYGKIGSAAIVGAALVSAFAGNLGAQLLRGSQASVERMHSYAVNHSYEFLRTTAAVRTAATGGKLVALARSTTNYELHQVQHPYLMPAAKLFVERLAAQYHSACGEKLVVTSAARPSNMRVRNASDLSVHATGMAVDVRSFNIPVRCKTWLRSTLESLERTGVIEATEERIVPHFHIAVFPAPYTSYVAALSNTVVAAADASSSSASGPSDDAEIALNAYQVRNGDSLWRIATKHDTTVQALQELNKLRSETIHPGQVILVPATTPK